MDADSGSHSVAMDTEIESASMLGYPNITRLLILTKKKRKTACTKTIFIPIPGLKQT